MSAPRPYEQPAFPNPQSHFTVPGLTKREHFAGLAMQALMSLPPDTLLLEAQREGMNTVGEYVRDQAYSMADLMLDPPTVIGAQR